MPNFDDVAAFHDKFDLLRPDMPCLLTDDVLQFRHRFMQEEVDEFLTAHTNNDLATAADSLVDLVYVAMGTAVMMGLPWEAIWTAVQRANMAKVRATSAAHSATSTGRGHAQDVVKPAEWTPPDIELVLDAATELLKRGLAPTPAAVDNLLKEL